MQCLVPKSFNLVRFDQTGQMPVPVEFHSNAEIEAWLRRLGLANRCVFRIKSTRIGQIPAAAKCGNVDSTLSVSLPVIRQRLPRRA